MAVSRTTNLDWYTTPFTEHLIYSMSLSLERQPETWKNWSSIWNKFTRVYVPFLRKINLREEKSYCFLRKVFKEKTWKEQKPEKNKNKNKNLCFLKIRSFSILLFSSSFPPLKLKEISKIAYIVGKSHSIYF